MNHLLAKQTILQCPTSKMRRIIDKCLNHLFWFSIFIGIVNADSADSISLESLSHHLPAEWGATPADLFSSKSNLRAPGFPVSVRVMKEPQSGKIAYETWITQEEKLAGESVWLADAVIGYAENRIFATPKRLSNLLDEAGLFEGSEKKEHSTQDYESMLKEIENMKVRDLKLSWPNEYKEAIEHGDMGFLHAASPDLKWFLLTKGVVRDASGALKKLLAEDMAVLTVHFTAGNSSSNQQIYIEDAFWLVDSDDALISKLVPTNNPRWIIKPNASADFSLSTSIPNTGAMEAKPTYIVNILRGIRWKVPPVPEFRTEETPWWKFW